MRRDLRAIRDELHGTTLTGADLHPQQSTARHALRLGLDASARSRLADRRRSRLLSHLTELTVGAEELRVRCPGQARCWLAARAWLLCRYLRDA